MQINKRLISFSSFYGMLIIGVSLSMASPILIEISNTFEKPISITATVFTFYFIGYAFGPFLSKFFCKAVRRKIAIGVVFFIQTAFIFIFPFSNSLYFAFFIYFVIGLCGGFNDAALSTLLVEINPGKEGFFMNISHVFLSFGAFAGPYISSLTLNSGLDWQVSFYFFSAFSLLNLIIFIFIRVPNIGEFDYKIKKAVGFNLNKVKRLPSKSYIYLITFLAIAVFLYTFSESGLNAWTPTFLRLAKNYSQINSSQILSFFWLAITLGRGVMGFISTKVNLSKATIIISVIGALCVILGIFSNKFLISVVAFSAAGFFYSGIFPNILAIASIKFKKSQDTAISLLITCAAAGGLLAPQFVGIVYRFSDIHKGLLAIGILPLITALLIFYFNRIKDRKLNL